MSTEENLTRSQEFESNNAKRLAKISAFTDRYGSSPVDHLHKTTMQLSSLLQLILGEGQENFDNLSARYRDGIVWAMLDLAQQSEQAALLVKNDAA